MDIIDIMLAKAMTPQGQTDIYVSKANKAAAKAAKAEQDAAAAIAVVESAAATIAETQEAAGTLLETAQDALETAQAAQINIPDTEDIDAEVKKLDVSVEVTDSSNSKLIQVITTYPDNTLNTENVTRLYKSTGNNEDGTMTQKAITTALDTKVNTSLLDAYASKQYVNQAIAAIPSGGGSGSGNMSGNINSEDAGHLVAIDENGNLIPSSATEDEIIKILLQAGTYVVKDAVGLDIDYANHTYTRIQGAVNKSMGQDFNNYTMYGGRVKCNVSDNGTINAFYGDDNYTEDGSNGQVMIYQPKFYYKRIFRTTEDIINGTAVRHEALILSATPQQGFKLAPIFNGDLDYVLFPAYDAGIVDSKLVSIAGVKPVNNLTITQAEIYAKARGTGWHIMNMAAESANQMLEIVEFGTLNGQAALEQGITYMPNNAESPCFFITGSTTALGNGTGHATSTTYDTNNTTYTASDDKYRAITYRGMENPWGNFWSMIGGTEISGDGTKQGGSIYICNDFNYTPGIVGTNYSYIGFNLPSVYGWVNAMGKGTDDYDWVYMPIECGTTANSANPVGDGLWTVGNLNGTKSIATGGSFGYKEECGPFYYAADRAATETARVNYGAKIMHIPTKNAIYTENIAKWTTYMGG